MKLPRICIEKPVFATVLNLIVLLLGIICFSFVHLRYHPKVFQPSLAIITNYPGASAEVIESAITDKLESALAKTPDLDSMFSTSLNGRSFIRLSFKNITKTDFLSIQSDVSRLLSSASKDFPDNVVPEFRGGAEDNMIFFVGFNSDKMQPREVGDYLENNVVNMLSRLPGVSSAEVFGPSSALRISIDPKKLSSYQITVPELINTLNNNNKILSLGDIINKDQMIAINSKADIGHISKIKDLIIAKRGGSFVHLSQVAKVSIGNQDISHSNVIINGKPGAGLSISVNEDANPIEVGRLVHKELGSLQNNFPQGMHLHVLLDLPKIMKLSLDDITKTIIEAIILVVIITILFLGNLRLSLIPIVTIPICLLGACIFLYMFRI